jgi:sugar fermentation stimulation protein A
MVLLPSPLQEAFLSHRLNRFAALVEVDGRPVAAHLPNSGRLHELLQPGNRVFLAPKTGARKTPFDMVLVEAEGHLVSCDARLPPAILAEAIRQVQAPPFAGYETVRREVTFGESRLDLLLAGPRGRCFIETKSVTLVEEGVALFPDAPTERGRRHLGSLAQAVRGGVRAAVVFVVQREDATSFAPHRQADPLFAEALAQAMAAGVEAYAYRCRVDLQSICLAEEVPVLVPQGLRSFPALQ